MKLLTIITASATICFFASCKKDNSTNNPGNSTSKIKTYKEDVTSGGQHDVVTFDVNYDNSNRVTSVVSQSNPGDKFVYTYANGKNTLDLYNSGALSIHNEFYLDSRSFIDSAFQYNDTQDTTTDKFFYNSANQLVKDITYAIQDGVQSVDDITTNTWNSDGNVSTSIDGSGTTTYQYYTDKLNNIQLFLSFSVTDKNLVKVTSFSDGTDTIVFNHTYTFDSQNRVLTETAVDDAGDIAVKTYTYY